MSDSDAEKAKSRAEWLHRHMAPRDWIVLTAFEVATIRAELAVVKRERDEALEALRELWQSADAYLPACDPETLKRWRKAAGWKAAK
jgi:hypothetical protein